jgi:hypothetical protein
VARPDRSRLAQFLNNPLVNAVTILSYQSPREAFDVGLALFDERRWDEAVTALAVADAETPATAAAYWLAQARFEQARHTPASDPMTAIARWQGVVASLHAARQVASRRVEVDMTLLNNEALAARSYILTALQALGAQSVAHRATSLSQLETLMRGGRVPFPLPDGRMQGVLLAFAFHPIADYMGRGVTWRWLPWQGKVFDRAAARGDNIFDRQVYGLARNLFRRSPFRPDTSSTYRACDFRLWVGPSLADGAPVLKLDYDLPTNPAFPVRRVVDELGELSDGVYLGRAFVRTRAWQWRLAAYFALTPM